jgi:probable H4MPT-linked C1 transfer pathway protein
MTGITRTRAGSQVQGFVGLDVGGVNTKAARWRDGQIATVSRPLEVWRGRDALADVIAGALREVGAGGDDEVALTMTAELSDAFAGKREGVEFVIDATEVALGGRSPVVLTAAGELVGAAAARARPFDVAAANWMATALEVAAVLPDALVIDIGSTTADVIPLAGGKVNASGRTDLDRLLAGELVYTGLLRTNLATIARRVPVRGGWCPVSSEQFAISADMHLILGHISPSAYVCPTPDGRAATVELARQRVARLVCSDLEQVAGEEIDAIAAYLYGEQLRLLTEAAQRAGQRCPAHAPVVALGTGSFLAREVAARIGCRVAPAPAQWGRDGATVAPAAGLAGLLARRAGAAA